MKCDLHLHTTCSDGSLSPRDIVLKAKEVGLDCIAVTDHDTVNGVLPAIEAGKEAGVKVLCGMEVSSVSGGTEVHVLGYNLDLSAAGLQKDLRKLQQLRNRRNVLLAEKLKEHGMSIDLSAIPVKHGSIGRVDIATQMVAKGYCKDVSEAFDLYIGKGKPCYVASKRLTPSEAVAFIAKYGGVSVLAHPKNLKIGRVAFEKMLKGLVNDGLDGIEAEYFTHTTTERRYFGEMAQKYGLIVTGGSDYHNDTHGVMIGKKYFTPNEDTARKLKLYD